MTGAMRHRPVSHPRSSNRTCRFPASGFPTGFIVGHTSVAQLHPAQPQHSEFAEDFVVGEFAGASCLHLVTPRQEVSNALIDVIIDRPISLHRVP